MLVTVSSFKAIQEATKIIQEEGTRGFLECEKLVGAQIAVSLLIGHIRYELCTLSAWPQNPIIDDEVSAVIKIDLPHIAAYLKQPHALYYTSGVQYLDNCAAFTILDGGTLYPTLEHGYHVNKYEKIEIREAILRAGSPYEAKRIAKAPEYIPFIRKDWQESKVSVMRRLKRLKRDQHKEVRDVLQAVQGVYLIEDSPEDSFWGRGPDWMGENMDGKLWMELQHET